MRGKCLAPCCEFHATNVKPIALTSDKILDQVDATFEDHRTRFAARKALSILTKHLLKGDNLRDTTAWEDASRLALLCGDVPRNTARRHLQLVFQLLEAVK